LSVLMVVSVFAKLAGGRGPGLAYERGRKTRFHLCIRVAPWLALLVYSAKSGMTTAARLISPYYPLLLPLLIAGGAVSRFIRSRLWHILVFGNVILALAVLILTPPRPLWPAQTVLSNLAARHPASHLISRAQKVYSLYSGRYDPLPGVRNLLPKNITVVGFAGGVDDAEISLWLPLGSRRVEDFLLSDAPAEIRKRGIEYAVISDIPLQEDHVALDDWLKKSDAELLGVTHATLKIATGEQTFYLVRLKP
jgi:hypothetical protein